MATKISQAPKSAVKQHTHPKRDGYAVKSTWKVPNSETSDSKHKATNTFVSWDVFYSQGKKTKIKLTRSGKLGGTNVTTSSMNINSFKTTGGTRKEDRGKTFTREDFWPYTTRKLTSIDHNVVLLNGKGKGPVSTATLTIKAPAAPTITKKEFDVETGIATITIKAAKSNPGSERKRTNWKLSVQRMNGTAGQTTGTGKKKKAVAPTVTTGTFGGDEKKVTYDVKDYQSLNDGEWYLVTISATSQGLGGDSNTSVDYYVVGPPAAVTIVNNKTTKVSITTGGNGRVIIPISKSYIWYKPKNSSKKLAGNKIDGVILQAAVNVAAKNSSAIPGDAWSDVGTVDNGECTHLAANSADLTPEENNYTYIRVKSWRFDPDCAPMCRYSNIYHLAALRTIDSASDDEMGILELTPTSGGDGARVLLGFDRKDGSTRDDADGTELSWADSSIAWQSTKPPSTFEFTWKDATSNDTEGQSGYPYKDLWYYTQLVYIDGLEEGTQYWVRARRYNDDANGNRTYGGYATKIMGTKESTTGCPDAVVIPVISPTSVKLSLPPSVPVGSDLQLTWTYDGGDQTAYCVYLGGTDRIVRQENTSTSYCVLKQTDYQEFVREDGTLLVKVSVSTSKRRDVFVQSEWTQVTFAEPPVLEAIVPTVIAQPMEVWLYSSTASTEADIVIYAGGVDGSKDVGIEPQVEGDDVWGDTVRPTWTATTWGETEWYRQNAAPVVAAADTAFNNLPIVSESFTGGTTAQLVEIPVEGDEEEEVSAQVMRTYAVIHPSGIPGSYMSATLDVDGKTWGLATEPVWCNANGEETVDGTYMRLAWPLSLSEDDPETPKDEVAEAFNGCTITLSYLPQGQANDDAWTSYTVLRVAADEAINRKDADGLTYEAIVTMPSGIDLRDTATYTLQATVEGTSGLTSNVAEAEFEVAWAHQAPKVEGCATVTPYDETDEDGIRTIGAVIKLTPPDGVAETDMADIWRVSVDGWHRIAEGRAFTEEVVDEYAPYGDAELAYRVVSRTADGDVDWVDFEYTLRKPHTRLDFGDEYIELPYNLNISHSYTKDSEQRSHLGEELPQGYWGSSHGRTFSISSDMIRSVSASTRALIHRLGSYMGPVLVRTPDGCCMEAEVTADHSITYNNVAVPVSINGTEIELMPEHMAVEAEPEGGEEP